MKKVLLTPAFCILLFVALISSTSRVKAQNPQWINYIQGSSIRALAEEGNNMWVGTSYGLVKIDKTTGVLTYYNSANSGLSAIDISSIAIDENGMKWIGTYWNGIIKFDGTNWTTYDTSNSGLPKNYVNSIVLDESETKWIGTFDGLAKFDGTNWTTYNTSNSGLPNDNVTSIAIDEMGTVWIGNYYDGLTKFDGVDWITYNTSNSGLPSGQIRSIAIDKNGTEWIGTWGGGLAKFDGINWTTYNTSNSGLLSDKIYSIAIDVSGTKWIGTYSGGLSVYNENGIPFAIEENRLTENEVNISPNPASDYLNIELLSTKNISTPHTNISLCCFNIFGQEIYSEQIYQYQEELKINVRDWMAGIYLVVVYSDGKKVGSAKFVMR